MKPEELAYRIVAEGGAIHPDIPSRGKPYGLVVVCSSALEMDVKLSFVAIALHLKEKSTSPLLETSRQRLWARVQDSMRELWQKTGLRAIHLGDAWDLLDEVWKANRVGERLIEFPLALKKLRAAMMKSFGDSR